MEHRYSHDSSTAPSSLSGCAEPGHSIYLDERIALLETPRELKGFRQYDAEQAFVAMLCTEGMAQINTNGEMHEMHRNDLFISTPFSLLENLFVSTDFKCAIIGMSTEYIRNVVIHLHFNWDIPFILKNQPLLHLSEEEMEAHLAYFRLLLKRLTTPDTPYHHIETDTLIKAMFYQLLGAMSNVMRVVNPRFTSAETITNEFLRLLAETHPVPRSIAFYARTLHVTPKYLCTATSKIYGTPPSKIIARYAVSEIEDYLRRPNLTIKEITNRLGFPSATLFGRYVRRNLGVSPREYRLRLQNKA